MIKPTNNIEDKIDLVKGIILANLNNQKIPPKITTVNTLEDINLTQEGFYNKLKSGANVSTSQPSIAYVSSIWDELLNEYDEVIYIPMSSGLSKSCAAAALEAKTNYNGKVYVVDNQRISVTQRQTVLEAIKMANDGLSGSEIHAKLEEQKMNSDIFIMVDTLTYLKKGGRITPAAAALGGALKIKPILRIKGEKLDKFHMMNRTVSTEGSFSHNQ
jgi:DegV family protein with EDD domain